MVLNTKLKTFLGGIFAATGTWMIVVPLSSYLTENMPIQNSYIIGTILILVSWYLLKNK